MKVRATKTGYYDHLRRREGDVFELKPIDGHKVVNNKLVKHHFTVEEQFSPNWMEKVDRSTPEKVSTAQGALNEVSNGIKSGRAPATSRSNAEVI